MGDAAAAALPGRAGELVRLLQALIRCHPIYDSPGQRAALSLAAAHLGKAGFTVRMGDADPEVVRASPHHVDVAAFGGDYRDHWSRPRPSLRATRTFTDGAPHVVLNGHVDVEAVTSPSTWSSPGLWASGEVRDGCVYGRGASDMLGGVACFLHVLEGLAARPDRARGTVTVQLVLDEEVGGNGTLWELLSSEGPAPDVAVIAEPTDGVVCGSTRGFHQLSVLCRGRPIHMGCAGEHDNAVRSLPDVVAVLEGLDGWVRRQSGGGSGRFVMYGLVRAGTDAAVPAAEAEVAVTLALPPRVPLQAAIDRLEGELALLAGGPAGPPRVAPYGVSFAGSDLTDPGLTECLLAAGRAEGVTLRTGEFPSACDARLFEAMGIPAVVYGPGSLARAHASDEHVTITELQEYSRVLASTFLRMWEAPEAT